MIQRTSPKGIAAFPDSLRPLCKTFFLCLVCTATALSAGGQHLPAGILINGRDSGRVFDGVGAISAGGSSRLLYDYPEPERSQILDYLFKPNYGASLQILKVEIGGDMNSTDGAEASHMRSPGDCNCGRGYEWWLIREAKKRNPRIKLIALAWGAPGWVGKFWSHKTITYIMRWLDCARSNGIRIDYVGGWNERGWNADWYIALHHALEKKYPHIKIIAADDVAHPWSVATEMARNPALREAVDIVGDHSECGWRSAYKRCRSTQDARSLGKPLWNSEYSSMGYKEGAGALARGMNRLYIEGKVTGILVWSLVSAWYANLPIANTGLMLAEWPWSGYYDVGTSIWVFAHTAQFVRPGWRYLDHGCGFLPSGASYVSLKSADGSDYTSIIETMDLKKPQTVRITIRGGLPQKSVHVWETDLRSPRSRDHFLHSRDITPVDSVFSLRLQPGHLYTVSTTTGQRKGNARPAATVEARMPLPYAEDFEQYGPEKLARYFSDLNGAFQTAPCPGGRGGKCYAQVISRQPVIWNKQGRMQPTTVIGDPRWWGDYEVSTDVLLKQPGYVEVIGRIAAQMDTIVAGYHLRVHSDGDWKLYSASLRDKVHVLASGKVPFDPGWHRIALWMKGRTLKVIIDGNPAGTVSDSFNLKGQAGLATSRWTPAWFDSLRIIPTGPAPVFVPSKDISVSASSAHPAFFRGYAFPAGYATDDRPESAWHSEWVPKARLPQSITLDLGRIEGVRGLTCRSDFIPFAKGKITGYRVYVSRNGRSFRQVASGSWPANVSTHVARWPERRARYVKLEAVKGPHQQVSAAEIHVMLGSGSE